MNRYKIYFNEGRKGYKLIDEISVRNLYENRFWFKPMPTIGERKCREIIRKIYPNYTSADGILVVFENVDTGERHSQNIYRNGTIITGC